MKKILIVEDEVELANILRDYLLKNDFDVTLLHSGADAVEKILRNHWDLVLLDLMLPVKDGLHICQEVRKTSDVPVIMVTAKVEEVDRLIGLHLGADDYICKPYSPREVVARVEAVLRRSARITPQHSSTESDLQLNKDTLKVSYQEQETELTLVECNILRTLMTKPDRIFSRNELMDNAYNDNRVVNDRTIDSHITKLRKKLRSITGVEVIRSVYGAGYKLELP